MSSFPAELRTLSVVSRWNIVWTLTNDTVANHSFFVTLYAREIAQIINWPGPMADLMFYALMHDAEEFVTGDIVGPTKREIVDNDRAKAYIQAKMGERVPKQAREIDRIEHTEGWGEQIKLIVKAADRLDALLFLTMEKRLGNGVIAPLIPDMWKMMRESWNALPWPREYSTYDIDGLYHQHVATDVQRHEKHGGYGV